MFVAGCVLVCLLSYTWKGDLHRAGQASRAAAMAISLAKLSHLRNDENLKFFRRHLQTKSARFEMRVPECLVRVIEMFHKLSWNRARKRSGRGVLTANRVKKRVFIILIALPDIRKVSPDFRDAIIDVKNTAERFSDRFPHIAIGGHEFFSLFANVETGRKETRPATADVAITRQKLSAMNTKVGNERLSIGRSFLHVAAESGNFSRLVRDVAKRRRTVSLLVLDMPYGSSNSDCERRDVRKRRRGLRISISCVVSRAPAVLSLTPHIRPRL